MFLISPFLLASTFLSSEKVNPDFNTYRIIVPQTRNEYDYDTYSKEVEIIQTNSYVVSLIKEYLFKNDIDISNINITLYLEELSTSRKGNKLKNTINPSSKIVSSPWMELIETTNFDGEVERELKIDAGYVRLMLDLFADPKEKFVTETFQEVSSLSQTCFRKIEDAYTSYMTRKYLIYGRELFELTSAFDCAPEPIRIPLLSVFLSASQTDLFPMIEPVYQRLERCLPTAQEYYSELYPRLALRALQILESDSTPNNKWWTKVTKKIDPIQLCPRKNK